MSVSNASFSNRLLAYNVDLTLLLVLILPLSFFIDNNRQLYVISFFIVCLYHAIFESSKWQATPGKYLNKMKVQQIDGSAISFIKAFFRILSKFLSLIVLFGGFFIIYFRKDRRGLHDIIVGTEVLKVDKNPIVEKKSN